MCEECSVHRVTALIAMLNEALAGLDAEAKHTAAALVAEAIARLEADPDVSR